PDFSFHPSCGNGITLSNSNTTAKLDNQGGSIVLSHAPIKTGWIYEVKASNCRIDVGICDWTPGEEVPRSSLPDSAVNSPRGMSGLVNGWRMGVFCGVMHGLAFTIDMKGTPCKFTPPKNLDSESKIGVMLDEDRKLHLYVDSHDKGVVDFQDKGVVPPGQLESGPQWYAFWELETLYQQVC
ncbi:hypothetical protein BaRGS_00004378, partial [Batillaria attramentaria]